jgi:hypothetical protein
MSTLIKETGTRSAVYVPFWQAFHRLNSTTNRLPSARQAGYSSCPQFSSFGLMTNRRIPVHNQGRRIRRMLAGLTQYYGVLGNRRSLDAFRTEICRQWRKALRRRGNKRPNNWCAVTRLIRQWVPSVRIVHLLPIRV